MDINQIIQILKGVVTDWRFIVTIVAMLFTVIIANKIVNYRKRPKRPKKNKKKGTPAPAPKPVEKKETESEEAEE